MKNTIKTIWNGTTTVLLAVVVILAVLLWGVRLVGLDLFIVQSGSMEPKYPTGSIVYVKETAPEELEVGDVITFNLSGNVRGTHRIIDIVPDEQDPTVLRFKTKGDANEVEDSGLVESKNIVGKALFCIPQLGYFAAYIQSPSGTYLAFAGAALLLLLLVLPDLIFSEKKEKKEEVK